MLQQLLIITLTWNTLTSWHYLQCWPWLLSPATIWQHLQRLPVLPSTKEFYHPGQRKFIKRSFSLKRETIRYSTWLKCQQSLHEESSLRNDWKENFKLIWGEYPLFNTAWQPSVLVAKNVFESTNSVVYKCCHVILQGTVCSL